MMRSYPNLSLLFGAYLHQDWAVENADPDSAVRLFAECEEAAAVRSALKEVEDILSEDTMDDFSLSDAVHNLGSYYDPTEDGRTWRSWLTNVHRILKESLDGGDE